MKFSAGLILFVVLFQVNTPFENSWFLTLLLLRREDAKTQT